MVFLVLVGVVFLEGCTVSYEGPLEEGDLALVEEWAGSWRVQALGATNHREVEVTIGSRSVPGLGRLGEFRVSPREDGPQKGPDRFLFGLRKFSDLGFFFLRACGPGEDPLEGVPVKGWMVFGFTEDSPDQFSLHFFHPGKLRKIQSEHKGRLSLEISKGAFGIPDLDFGEDREGLLETLEVLAGSSRSILSDGVMLWRRVGPDGQLLGPGPDTEEEDRKGAAPDPGKTVPSGEAEVLEVPAACRCPEESLGDRLERADQVFQGRATAVESLTLPGGQEARRLRFRVKRRWKGPPVPEVDVWLPGGKPRPCEPWMDGMDVLLLGHQDGGRLWTGHCDGTVPVEDADLEELRQILGPGRLPEAPRGVPGGWLTR